MCDIENKYNIIKNYVEDCALLWRDLKTNNLSIYLLAIKHGVKQHIVEYKLKLAELALKHHDDYEFIKQYDAQAAEVWLSRKLWASTHISISETMNVSPSQSRQAYNRAKYILKHKNEMWTVGLSNRAKFALLRNGYKNLKELVHDLEINGFSLSDKDGIGETTAEEVQRWIGNKKAVS